MMRTFLRLAAAGIVIILLGECAFAANPPIDRARVAAARALAARYWHESGLDNLPRRYETDRFQNAINGEDDPYNIVAAIAVATLSSNPGREGAVLKYLNESLLPYALSHKAQYLCLVSEVFYNSQSSTEELRSTASAEHSSDGNAAAFIEYAYFLIKTEPQREKLDLRIPADNGVPEAIAAFKTTLKPDGGSLVPAEAIKLGCGVTVR